MERLYIDGQNFYNMVVNASNKLEEQKEFVNSLNVFPVPDGDTGTNMSMTFKAAVTEIENINSKSIGEVAKVLAKGALMGARGNSGVILSQIFRGISKGLEGKNTVNAKELSNSFMEGTRSAYKAVMRPTEGTILTIIKAAGESATKSKEKDILKLMNEICKESESALNKTPEMLPVLKQAKVVDAGGMGLLIILKGMYEALIENIDYKINKDINTEATKNVSVNTITETDIKYGYCTEFFVITKNADIEKFKKDLESHGDSTIVVGLEDIIKVHIHTNDPGLILSKALKLGELSKIKIDNMREQHRHIISQEEVYTSDEEKKKYAFITVAMGDGITNIFKDLGVDYVIEGGQTMNPSTQDIVNCVSKINAENIFVLPNNKNIIMAAKQAAEISDKNIIVIPSKTIPQGITSITMFNPEVDVEENTENMIEAIESVKTGSITYAVRDTEMDEKTIKSGDVLGLVEGKINITGNDIYEVCNKIVSNMVDEDSELITLFYGKDCEEEKVNELVEKLELEYDKLDIQCFNGQQPLYYFIISVE